MSTVEVLSDVVLPKTIILAGLTGSLSRLNERTTVPAGYARVNVVRDATLRQFHLGVKPLLLSQWEQVMGIYEVTDAGAYGFLVEDPTDATVTQANGVLMGEMLGVRYGAAGYGNGTPNYVLQKTYGPAGSTRRRARDVSRPRGTPALYRSGAPVTIGAGAGNAGLSAGPVRVTFVPDATRTVSSVTVGATTDVVLSSAIGLTVGQRLWLQGLTGADAALLNGQSHEITNISTATYTLAVNTAGKTITAAGQGHKYPQPDETLTWAGSYYLPVQFQEDTIEWDLVRPGKEGDRLVQGVSITLTEVREL